MPELPEVETIARGLASRVTGDVIESVLGGWETQPQ
jgi:formamidopyrimidine-DNA glycosylase